MSLSGDDKNKNVSNILNMKITSPKTYMGTEMVPSTLLIKTNITLTIYSKFIILA